MNFNYIKTLFEEGELIDGRFQKVKIWLMHLGLNFNNSVFYKEVVEGSYESLKNIPILGYIEETRVSKDFKGHELELVIVDGEIRTKYLGSAYGVIPENCNPRFEEKDGLEYLVVDGLLWTKFSDAIEIITESGEVGQSMELHTEYSGHYNDENQFVFTDFKFDGACMLGKNVSPAMKNSTVELVYTNKVESVTETIEKKMGEYYSLFSKINEGVHSVDIQALLDKYSLTVDTISEKGIDVSTLTYEEIETKLSELFESEAEVVETPVKDTEFSTEDNAKEVDPEQVEPELNHTNIEDDGKSISDKFTKVFEMSHDDVRSKLWNGIESHMETSGKNEGDYSWYYLVSVFDTFAYVESNNGKFFKVDYSKADEVVSFGSVTEVYPSFLTVEEKGALELVRNTYETIKNENEELKMFKKSVQDQEHVQKAEELFSQFSKLEETEVADIRENVSQYSLENIESILFERLGRKSLTFSQKTNKASNKISVSVDNGSQVPDSYSHLFKKHGFAE